MRCNEFLTTVKLKAIHDFLKHYDDSKSIPFEEKLLDIIRYPALRYILLNHSDFQNFYNSEKCVDDFLKNVKYRFKSTSKKWFKCSFNIENTQNFIRPDLEPLLNTRYWTTEYYNSTYFNDFIFFGLRQDILKLVIIKNMSDNAWHFKRLVCIAVRF